MFHVLSNHTICSMKHGGCYEALTPPVVEIRVSVSAHYNRDTFSKHTVRTLCRPRLPSLMPALEEEGHLDPPYTPTEKGVLTTRKQD